MESFAEQSTATLAAVTGCPANTAANAAVTLA